MQIDTTKCNCKVNVLWDTGATKSLITFSAARKLKLRGHHVKIMIMKVGGESELLDSYLYKLPLRNKVGKLIYIMVYGVEKNTSVLQPLDTSIVFSLFPGLTSYNEVERPNAEVDVLIGTDYSAFQPQIMDMHGHLTIVANQFGKCLAGRHPLLRENTKKIVPLAIISPVVTHPCCKEFFIRESIGTQ